MSKKLPSVRKGRPSRANGNLVGLNRLTALNVGIRQRHEVENYITHYPGLAPVIEPICKRARDTFGIGAELELDLYKGPEDSDQYLTLCVRLEKYEPGILDRIEQVANKFAAKLEKESGDLLITTDFRRPKR